MTWFAAHAVMYFKLKGGAQGGCTVWENVYLIEAEDIDAAWERAEARARQEEGDDDGSLTFDDRPATCVFAGLRKMSEVAHGEEDGRLRSGDEITYSEFEVPDEASVRAYVGGEEVLVRYRKFESEPESDQVE